MKTDSESVWDKIVGDEVFVIAEIGKNFIQTQEERPYSEYLSNARQLIDEAKRRGASAVKFQTHCLEDEQLPVEVWSAHFKGMDRYGWVSRNSALTDSGFWREIRDYCRQQEIIFFSTPMSRKAAQVLQELDVSVWKVGSGDILDFVMLDFIRNTNKPVIISSGMSSLAELDLTMNFLLENNKRVALMYCVSKYPCQEADIDLRVMDSLRERYQVPVGLSDHTVGIGTAVEAVDRGAGMIEKHFSFDRSWWGSDHKVSMLPDELQGLVEAIKRPRARGSVRKEPVVNLTELADSGSEFRPLFRKSLVAAVDIKKGTKITPEMLYAMRPQAAAGGIPSQDYGRVLNKRGVVDMEKYDVFTEEKLAVDDQVLVVGKEANVYE